MPPRIAAPERTRRSERASPIRSACTAPKRTSAPSRSSVASTRTRTPPRTRRARRRRGTSGARDVLPAAPRERREDRGRDRAGREAYARERRRVDEARAERHAAEDRVEREADEREQCECGGPHPAVHVAECDREDWAPSAAEGARGNPGRVSPTIEAVARAPSPIVGAADGARGSVTGRLAKTFRRGRRRRDGRSRGR